MNTYILLLRGINVGGNNKVSMSELKTALTELGFQNVTTYINSGNVILDTELTVETATKKIEKVLSETFKLNPLLNKILILNDKQLKTTVAKAPKGFGSQPEIYHSDVAFLIEKSVGEAMEQVETNPDVDKAWAGQHAIYYQRVSALRTRSRLNKVISKPIYKYLTIRNWNTVSKLLKLIEERKAK